MEPETEEQKKNSTAVIYASYDHYNSVKNKHLPITATTWDKPYPPPKGKRNARYRR